ncbi:phage holin family protein [Chromatiaceae bacterium AAb-1]|nr:phage holin family protein [Chromatiaceae bacterium AAb-1]
MLQSRQGPASGLFSLSKRILSQLVAMAESRLRLAAIELEEEKLQLTRLLLLAGISLLCLAFALMSLLILICWAIDPVYRFTALSIMTATLFILAVAGISLTLRKSRQTNILAETRRQLKQDLQTLQEPSDGS